MVIDSFGIGLFFLFFPLSLAIYKNGGLLHVSIILRARPP